MSTHNKKALILDAGVVMYQAQGELNHYFAKVASEILTLKGMEVNITRVGEDYDIETEKNKLLQADLILVQTPGFWMSTPWQFKKYVDECFGCLAAGMDGRHRDNPDAKYGSGGIHKNKFYMISSTWNAPLEAFNDPKQFFGGRGVEGVFLPLHKTFEFIGARYLPSFIANDVIKNPQIEEDIKRFKAHLEQYIKI